MWVDGEYRVELNGFVNDDGCFECEEYGDRVPMFDMMNMMGYDVACCYEEEEDEDDEWEDEE